MLNKTLQLKGEKCHGGKKSKERLTVLATSNMDGSEKITTDRSAYNAVTLLETI
jgi:hypothetical protein